MNNDLTKGSVWKQLLLFSIPVFFASVLQQLYNMIDVWFVGNYIGTAAVAAIGGTTSAFINISLALFNGFSAAITVIVGQCVGAKKKDETVHTIKNAVMFSVVVGMLIGFLCISITPKILQWCQVPNEIVLISKRYLYIYFLGTTFSFSYNVTAGILRAMGDSRSPLFVLVLCCLMNIVVDMILICQFHLGVEGAAIATVFAQTISFFINLALIKRRQQIVLWKKERKYIYPEILKKIIVLGIPCGIQNMAYGISNIIMQSVINQFGTKFVAAFSIYGKIDILCWFIVESFGIALTAYTAQNYAAQQEKRIRMGLRYVVAISYLLEGIAACVVITYGENIFKIFTSDQQVIGYGMEIISLIAPFYLCHVWIELIGGVLRGMGKTVGAMLVTFTGICVFRTLWVVIASHLHLGYVEVLRNYRFTWGFTSVLFIIYYIFTNKNQKITKKT